MEIFHPANQPAFPTPDGAAYYGMSKREYYAALNMAQMMRSVSDMEAIAATNPDYLSTISAIAVSAADALLRELERTKPEDPDPDFRKNSNVAAFASVNTNTYDDIAF